MATATTAIAATSRGVRAGSAGLAVTTLISPPPRAPLPLCSPGSLHGHQDRRDRLVVGADELEQHRLRGRGLLPCEPRAGVEVGAEDSDSFADGLEVVLLVAGVLDVELDDLAGL